MVVTDVARKCALFDIAPQIFERRAMSDIAQDDSPLRPKEGLVGRTGHQVGTFGASPIITLSLFIFSLSSSFATNTSGSSLQGASELLLLHWQPVLGNELAVLHDALRLDLRAGGLVPAELHLAELWMDQRHVLALDPDVVAALADAVDIAAAHDVLHDQVGLVDDGFVTAGAATEEEGEEEGKQVLHGVLV